MLVIAEEEGNVGEQRVGNKEADRPGRGEDEVEAAVLGAGDQFAFAAECAGREDLNLVAAVRAAFQVGGQCLRTRLEGRGFRLRVAEAQLGLRLSQRGQSGQAEDSDKREQAHQ